MAEQSAGDASSPDGKLPTEITFHFIKSNYFRVVHVDGMWGSVTPDGHIHVTLYNERTAIPKTVVFGISHDGTEMEEIVEKRESKEGMVREVEMDLVMDLDTARGFREWIANAVSEAEDLSGESE